MTDDYTKLSPHKPVCPDCGGTDLTAQEMKLVAYPMFWDVFAHKWNWNLDEPEFIEGFDDDFLGFWCSDCENNVEPAPPEEVTT